MELRVELLLLCVKRNQLRWFGHLLRTLVIWLENISRCLRRSREILVGEGMPELPWWTCCHHDQTPGKSQKTHGWIELSWTRTFSVWIVGQQWHSRYSGEWTHTQPLRMNKSLNSECRGRFVSGRASDLKTCAKSTWGPWSAVTTVMEMYHII